MSNVNNSLVVTRDTNLNGLGVDGAATLYSDLTISGTTDLNGELDVALATTLRSDLTVIGDLFVSGDNVELNHDLTVGRTVRWLGTSPSITTTETATGRGHDVKPTYIGLLKGPIIINDGTSGYVVDTILATTSISDTLGFGG